MAGLIRTTEAPQAPPAKRGRKDSHARAAAPDGAADEVGTAPDPVASSGLLGAINLRGWAFTPRKETLERIAQMEAAGDIEKVIRYANRRQVQAKY